MPPELRAIRDFDESRVHALIEVMYLAAQADEEFTPEERAHFASAVESLTDRRVTGEALTKLIAKIERELAASGREARLAAVKSSLGDTTARETAVAFAIRMLAADGVIRTAEREFILEIAEALEVDRGVAADLVKQLAA
jgi:tellurite resistance protein